MSDGCMARTHRAPRRAQIFRGNASRAGKPIWNGKIESGRKPAAAMPPLAETPQRGYAKLFAEQILGADEGCDFKFLMPR